MKGRKREFLKRLEKAMEKGWRPKSALLIPKIECLADDIFEKALDLSLDKTAPDKKE